MNKLNMNQKFFIVKGMNRNLILGRDRLKQNGVRLYFDLGCMRVGKAYVSLEEDIHISSIVRIAKNTILKPQTMTICIVKLNKGFCIPDSRLLEITDISDCIGDEPGITIQGAVSNVSNSQKIPVMIVNQTNKFYKLKRGNVVGKVKTLNPQDLLIVLHVNRMETIKKTSRK